MEERYDVYFTGQVQDGQDPQQVRAQLGKLFKADAATLDRLFSGKPNVVKRDCDRATARKYQTAMERAGAVPILRLQQAHGDAAASRTAAEKIAALAAAPDEVGFRQAHESQADSPAAVPADEARPETGDIGLAPPGTEVLAESERSTPVAREIDTSDLQVETADRLSEESVAPPPALDTSHLSVADAGAAIPNLPPSQAPLSPDTDHLALSAAGADFSDCATPDAPPPTLDLSGLTAEPPGSDILEERYRKQERLEMPATDHLSLGD